jgi:hypothetical protein
MKIPLFRIGPARMLPDADAEAGQIIDALWLL